jgi:hypothetical protein
MMICESRYHRTLILSFLTSQHAMEVTASDMESDGDDYEMSNQAASSEEEEVSSDESSEDSSGVFGVHKGMIGFTSTHVDDDDYGSEELYNINDGAL